MAIPQKFTKTAQPDAFDMSDMMAQMLPDAPSTPMQGSASAKSKVQGGAYDPSQDPSTAPLLPSSVPSTATAQTGPTKVKPDVIGPIVPAPGQPQPGEPGGPPLNLQPTPAPAPTTGPTPHTYTSMLGFDYNKLNNGHQSLKYDIGHALQDAPAWGRGNLQPLVDYINQTYGYGVSADGDDRLALNDGHGTMIDVLNANGDALQYVDVTGGDAAPAGSAGGNTGPSSASTLHLPTFPTTSSPMSIPGINGADDPLGSSINGGIMDLISHQGETTNQAALRHIYEQIIGNGGGLDHSVIDPQLESAREAEAEAETAMYNDADGRLAAQGIHSEPGVPQGQAASAINRINQTLAPPFATAVRDIYTNAQQQSDARLTTSLSSLLGLNNAEASQFLNTLGEGTQRQSALASIALQSLAQNMQWNEFLANYGLNADALLHTIQQGDSSQLIALLQLFNQNITTAAGGTI